MSEQQQCPKPLTRRQKIRLYRQMPDNTFVDLLCQRSRWTAELELMHEAKPKLVFTFILGYTHNARCAVIKDLYEHIHARAKERDEALQKLRAAEARAEVAERALEILKPGGGDSVANPDVRTEGKRLMKDTDMNIVDIAVKMAEMEVGDV